MTSAPVKNAGPLPDYINTEMLFPLRPVEQTVISEVR